MNTNKQICLLTDILNTVETEVLRKYDTLAHKLSLVHKCKGNISLFVLTWDRIVTTNYEKHRRNWTSEIASKYTIQSKVLHKTLEWVLDYQSKCEGEIYEREAMAVVNKAMLATTIEAV